VNPTVDADNIPSNFRAGTVPLAGLTNVGKSTLVNKLIGQKVSIASPKPQTTRHRIRAILNRPASQIVLLDTPGLHGPKTQLSKWMVRSALKSLDGADAILLLIEPRPWNEQPGLERIIRNLTEVNCAARSSAPTPVLLAINKMDNIPKQAVLPVIRESAAKYPFHEIIPVSAHTGINLDVLVEAIENVMPVSPPLFPQDMSAIRSERFLIGELIRETILYRSHQEVPHCVAVVIEAMAVDDAKHRMDINAAIIVERPGQKKILIGKQGSLIKDIGMRARQEIERIFPYHVRLELWVRVAAKWRDRHELLTQFGIEDH